jgi:hypothetical protein
MILKNEFRLFHRLSVIIAVGIFLYSCAIPYEFPTYPGHKTFVDSNTRKLKVGMTSEDFKTIFGMPDKMYNATFGEDVGEAWTGQVWLYFTERDAKFQYVKRYKKNMFVFYPSGRKTLLNHWAIEK